MRELWNATWRAERPWWFFLGVTFAWWVPYTIAREIWSVPWWVDLPVFVLLFVGAPVVVVALLERGSSRQPRT